ncbi:MAG: hypothetical protein CSA96_02415 [Bacteroidetes bacterium]|nr:MAG: hypothetical protein CSA96_02415 [Bacteroidota bacterium]
MNKHIDICIAAIEEKWLTPLYEACRQGFRGRHLPSHDHSHHSRVWNICKLLLRESNDPDPVVDQDFVEGLIIAAFFHDAGMAETSSPAHGKPGRALCTSWFENRIQEKPALLEEALEAIEYHDKKDASVYRGIIPGKKPEILGYLSIADDLDAFGHIGIYRYVEIYTERELPLSSLGTQIMRNASMRFTNIGKSCCACPHTLRAFKARYDTLINFFDRYNQQLLIEENPREIRSGYLGVVNHIRQIGMGRRIKPGNLWMHVDKHVPGCVVRDFFDALQADLKDGYKNLC